ncbi:MAG: methylmalonyl-CoA mutase family protein [Bryobacterales bacterium]
MAKFRAARRLYARLMRERYGARNERSLKMRFHVQTAGSSLTAQQPEVNVVRTAIEALSAVLGGCQSLHTNSLDEALALPTEAAAKLALRTQQVIAHESGVTGTIDPLAGSYCIEALTDEIEAGARAYLDKIDALGGMVSAIEAGFPQREIQTSAYEFQQKVESGEQVIVGVNRYQEDEEPRPLFKLDREAEARRRTDLADFRARRDKTRADEALLALAEVARAEQNLFPAVLHCVESLATLGEISDVLRRQFGTFQERIVI